MIDPSTALVRDLDGLVAELDRLRAANVLLHQDLAIARAEAERSSQRLGAERVALCMWAADRTGLDVLDVYRRVCEAAGLTPSVEVSEVHP